MSAGSPGNLQDALRAARLAAFLDLDPSLGSSESGAGTDPDLDDLVACAARVYRRAISDNTRATYVRRWRLFEGWCAAKGLAPLPCAPETLMLYLTDAAQQRGYAALGTLRGWAAAINRVHLEAGHPAPADDPAMTVFLRGLSRTVGPRARVPMMSALRIAELRSVCRMLDAIDVERADLRDRAVLVLHRERLSDGEIARLRWADVTLGPRSMRLRVMDPRTGGLRRTVVARRQRDQDVWAGDALNDWLATAGSESGAVFCLVDGARRSVVDGPMRAATIANARRSRLRSLSREGESSGQNLDRAIALLGQRPPAVLRDKAILLLGFAGAFRRTEVTGLRWDDIRQVPGGLVVHLRRSKTDQRGVGHDVGIPYGQSELTCPVKALMAWRARCETQLGVEAVAAMPCYVTVGQSGRIGTTPMEPESLTRMVDRRARQAGLAGRWGGRSLRAGFISTAADLQIPLERIARQSRHATLDSLVLYIRNDDPFRRNPAGSLGL